LIDEVEQLKYISDKLAFLSSKVERDNSQGLYNINKVSENIFLHLLNCSFNYNLEDANRVLYSDFPAIDLIDHPNNLVVQVTSTLTTQKIYNSIKKLRELENKKIASYELKMCYIARKPDFSDKELKNIKKRGLKSNDLLGIDDILTIAHSDVNKRKVIYNTLLQRLDSKAFTFDIKGYFNKFETQLNEITTNKFYAYNNHFETFIKSDANVLEIFATGGNGKSHLLRHFASLESNYTPILFTKQTNVEADLKHLDITERYLFIYDDIDRFLDPSINSIFSFVIDSGSKIIISYRVASKPLIENKISRFNSLKTHELYITWTEEEIKDLILQIEPKATEQGIKNINAQFNSNPYLITQALSGGIDEIKNFSKKTLTDATTALQKFDIKKVEIEELLYRVALLSPCPKVLIDKYDNDKIDELIRVGILRELNNKIRFNPDVLGDLYLASFVKNYENKYKEIILEYIKEHLQLVITNLSYVLSYEDNNGLELFFKKVIKEWLKNKDYKSSNLKILYRIVNFAPFESFRYLVQVTNELSVEENKHSKGGFFSEIISQVCEVDFNKSDEYINLGSIIPIINRLIVSLKYEYDLGKLKIKNIIDFLVSEKVLSFPEPYFVNHKLTSVFNEMIIPYEFKNNDVIVEALEQMKDWICDSPINPKKLDILESALNSLFEGTVLYHTNQKKVEFDTSKENIRKVIDKAKEILFLMLNDSNIDLKCTALKIFTHIGNSVNYELEIINEQYYLDIVIESLDILNEQITYVNDYRFLSKLDEVLLNAMAFRKHKDRAYNLFIKIPRQPIFTFNQLLIGKMHVVYDLDEFIEEYPKQEDVKEWLFEKHYNRRGYETSEEDKNLFNYFIEKYVTSVDFINFVNSLNFIENSEDSYIFISLLEYWYEKRPQIFRELSINELSKIKNCSVVKIVDNFILSKEIDRLNVDNINESCALDDLKTYVEVSFKSNNISLYKNLLMIFKKNEKENILWFINTSFSHFHRIIKNDTELNLYRHYIHELLDLIIQYRFTPSIFLVFILENLEKNNIPFEDIKRKIEKIIYIPSNQENLEEIQIDERNLKIIFNILNYILEDLVARIFLKICKIDFTWYDDNHKIKECYLIKDYIKGYTDYKSFVYLVINEYSNNFTYIYNNDDGSSESYKLNINYFFCGLKNEYFEQFIRELIENNNKSDLRVMLQSIPIKVKYMELLVEVLNFLENDIEDKEIIDLLIKERIPGNIYIDLLNENRTPNIVTFSTFDFIYKEITNQESVFAYMYENLLNINIISDVEEILTEIKQTKKIITEINLEQSIK
jgi:hypothetical protein